MASFRTWLALGAVLSAWLALASAADYSDLRHMGPFCGRQRAPRDCCRARKDDCSVPILGTLCYCDEFCNRTRGEDCCPDYWSHCMGMEIAPQATGRCFHNGQYLFVGQSMKINCNLCTCSTSGGVPSVMCEQTPCLVEPEVIASVNARESQGALPWRASNYTAFWGRRLDEGLSLRLGTLQPHKTVKRMRPILRHVDGSRLPRSFDARTHWPGKVSGVDDQGWCGASWALSTTAVANDRFAIMSMGEEPAHLSPQHLISCNARGQRGCSGGHLDRAWFFLRKYGVVDEECYPYTSSSGKVEACRLPRRTTLQAAGCSSQQRAGAARTDLYHMGPPYRLGNEFDIMQEIMNSGPVQATMKVYHDFFMYRGGIYEQSNLGAAERTGYHSVRILGWGEDYSRSGPIKYWIVANSWGALWGENGYFRIRRGNNECEIEDFVLASWADTVVPPVEKMMHNGNNHHSNVI